MISILKQIFHVIFGVIFDFLLDILKGVTLKCLKFIVSWMIKHKSLIRRFFPLMTWLLLVALLIYAMIIGVRLVSI
nr:MAG TPA: hypothetical protein [Microviridae sp.]